MIKKKSKKNNTSKKNNLNLQHKYNTYLRKRRKIKFLNIDSSFSFNEINQSDVAIIIPYRNRSSHLEELKKHFKNTKFDFYLIEQFDNQRFNRGILLNIGFDLASKHKNYKYYIFHDVDSLPDDNLIHLYNYIGDKIIHYASPYLGYKYNYSNFLGGVLGMNGDTFKNINGFSNRVYGWGGEDDMLYNRISKAGYQVYRPTSGSFILLEHPGPTKNERVPYKWEAILNDLNESKYDGLNDLYNLYMVYNMKESFDPHIFHYFVRIPIQHKKFFQYISILEPLIEWKEVKKNIIDTYTYPLQFKPKNNISKSPFNNIIQDKLNQSYENELSKDDLEKTLKFIFDTYRDFIYFRIRQNHIELSYHIYNKDYTTDWYKYVNLPNGLNQKSFLDLRQKKLKSFTGPLAKPNKWTALNCVVSLEDWTKSGNAQEYVIEIYEMVLQTIKKYKTVPDCDIIFNRRDFNIIHQTPGRYAHTSVYPENIQIQHPIDKYWIVCSQSTTDYTKDVPIPTSDEWFEIKNNKNNKNNKKYNWDNKIDKVVFRGSSTGCGLDESNNPRLRLSEISYKLNDPKIDIGIVSFVKKVKVNNFQLDFIDLQKYNHLKKDFVPMSDQANCKYLLNIEGNVSAYRLPNLFKYNSVVVNTESDYHMWFEPLLKNNKNYVLLTKNTFIKPSNSIDTSATKTKDFFDDLMDKDSKMKKIANEGKKFYDQYLQKDNILEYMYLLMMNINNYMKK